MAGRYCSTVVELTPVFCLDFGSFHAENCSTAVTRRLVGKIKNRSNFMVASARREAFRSGGPEDSRRGSTSFGDYFRAEVGKDQYTDLS
jgi:hypothetical protein